MAVIVQKTLPYEVSFAAPLPGVRPLAVKDWLLVDDAFSAQMAERARLLRQAREAVVALTDAGRDAAAELLHHVLDWLKHHAPQFRAAQGKMIRPDGVTVAIDEDDPLGTLGLLIQEDLCLMQKDTGGEHRLVAAVLCFPAGWRLADKIGQPLSFIHDPVPEYDDALARRVQRLFDGVQVGRPLWRYNALRYKDPSLFQPQKTPEGHGPDAPFLRSERQCILRLPETRACVFSIHSYVMRRSAVV